MQTHPLLRIMCSLLRNNHKLDLKDLKVGERGIVQELEEDFRCSFAPSSTVRYDFSFVRPQRCAWPCFITVPVLRGIMST